MGDKPSAAAQMEAFFRDVNRLTSTAVSYWTAMLFMAGVLAFLWGAVGPDHPMYGVLLAVWTFVLGPGVAVPVLLRVPPRWHQVPMSERLLHRILGVNAFGRMLAGSGYNRRFVHPQWSFAINRAGLPFRAQAARGGACAHGACFVIHIVLAAVALITGHAWGALWILLPGVVLHFYPAMLQRSILLRLEPLLAHAGTTDRSPQGT